MKRSQYIYTIKLTRPELLTDGPTEAEGKVLAEHFDYLKALANESRVLLAGRTQVDTPEAFGIVIIADCTQPEAEEMMNNDPAVKHGVMQARLYPYQIAVLSPSILEAIPSDQG